MTAADVINLGEAVFEDEEHAALFYRQLITCWDRLEIVQ